MTKNIATKRRGQKPGQTGVTLRDVAEAAGVSMMTVSNFFNNRHLLQAKTLNRVEVAVEKLGYRPNLAAQSLRLANFRSIGLLIVDRSPSFLADPFTTQLTAGLSNFINRRGYVLSLQGVSPDHISDASLFKSMRTDGLCLFLSGTPMQRSRSVELASRTGQPVVLFQEKLKASNENICSIREDDYGGGRWLAQHVLERGARRLLWLVPAMAWPALQERQRGMKDAVAQVRGASLRSLKYKGDYLPEVPKALESWIERNSLPDAVLAGNDQIGIAVLKHLESRKIEVPAEVLVTGFNKFAFWNCSSPLLTTVESPAYEIGNRGGKEMLRRVEGASFSSSDIILDVVPTEAASTARAIRARPQRAESGGTKGRKRD